MAPIQPHSPLGDILDVRQSNRYFAGDRDLYLDILDKFTEKYHGFRLPAPHSAEFRTELHALKSLAAMLGAMQLHQVITQIETTGDLSLSSAVDFHLRLALDEAFKVVSTARQSPPVYLGPTEY